MYQAWYCHGCGTRSLPLLPPSVEIHYQGNSSQRFECSMDLENQDTPCWCIVCVYEFSDKGHMPEQHFLETVVSPACNPCQSTYGLNVS